MAILKISSSISYNRFFLRFLFLTFMLACMAMQTRAQTFFKSPVRYPSAEAWHEGNSTAQSVDMDGDGDLDIVFTNLDPVAPSFVTEPFVHIRVNEGDGKFGAQGGLEVWGSEGGVRVILPSRATNFDIGDLNNDGLPDLAVTLGGSNVPFLVALNTSTGGVMSFDSGTNYGSGGYTSVSIDDINDDGNNDLIITRRDASQIDLYYGDGTGINWSPSLSVSGSTYDAHLLSDFNGDGILDIMAIQDTNSRLFYFRGNELPDGSQAGTFQSELTIGTFETRFSRLVEADFNGDGLLDIVATDEVDGEIGMLINDGDGTSFTETVHVGFTFDMGLAANDITNDGHLDFMVSDGFKAIHLFEGNGSGGFSRTTHSYIFGTAANFIARHVTSGDYDNDGLIDMASIDYGPNVFLNNTKADLEIRQAGVDIKSGEVYDFGDIPVGLSSGAIEFTIRNTGAFDATLNGTPKIQISGAQASMFSVDESSTSSTIAPGGSTTFTVTFTADPLIGGISNALLTIPSNDPNSGYEINLSGTTDTDLPSNGPCGTILDFDGVDDHVNFGNVLNLSNAITLEAWINTDGLGNRQGIIGKPYTSNNPPYYQYHTEVRADGKIYFAIAVNGQLRTVESTNTIEPNKWYHIAATYDGTVMKLYVDGVEWGTNTISGTISSYSTALRVGAPSDFEFNGQIDEVRIWGIARAQAEILADRNIKLTGTEVNLEGYWDFDDGLGSSSARDLTSNGNNGSLINMDTTDDWLLIDGSIDPNLDVDQFITFNSLADATYGDADITLTAFSNSGLPISYSSSNLNTATISGTTLTIVGAGTTTITASQAGDACTNPAIDALQSLTVNKAELTATLDDKSRPYGGANPTFTFSYSGFVNGENGSAIDTPPAGATTADETSDAGNYSITGSGGADNNYTFTFVDGTLTILKLSLLATIIDRTQVYGGTGSPVGFTYGGSGTNFVNGDDESDLDGEQLQTTSVDVNSPVGSYSISAIYDPNVDNNYDVFTFHSGTYTVTPALLTVTADDQSRLINNPNPPLTISYSGFVNGEDESVVNVLPTISTTAIITSPPGDYPITLVGGSDDNYDLTLVDGTLTVDPPIPLTITVDAQSKTYGDTDPVLTYQLTSGTLMPGDNLTGNLTRVTGEDVGTYAIEIGSLTAGSNYTITLISNDLTITPKAISVVANASQGKIYGQSDPMLLFTITAGSLAPGDTFSGALDRIPGENVGLYAIGEGTLSAGSNYTVTFTSSDFLILAKPIEVTVDASQSKVYGELDPVFAYTITSGSLEAGDVLTGTLDRSPGEDVGNYAIGVGTLTAGTNYSIDFLSNDLSISSKPITVTVHPFLAKEYGDPEPALTYTVPPGSLEPGDSFTGALDRSQGEDAGDYPINQGTLTAGANYAITFVSDNFRIFQRILTIFPDAGQSKTYGEVDPVFTYTTIGLLNGDALTGLMLRTSGENVGNYTFNEGTLDAGSNYFIDLFTDDFSVTPKSITVSADADQTKTYGDSDPTLSYAVIAGSLEPGDSFTGSIERSPGEDVGYYTIEQGTLDAGTNYDLAFISDDFYVGPKSIVVVPDPNQAKTYGETDPLLTYIVSGGLVGGDVLTGNLERQAGEDVGAYAISQGSLNGGPNYLLTIDPDDFTIHPATLTATANDQTREYNEGNPTFAISYSGFVNGDTPVDIIEPVASTVATQTSNAGTYPISLTGGSAANYSLILVNGTLNVSKANQTITFGPLDAVGVGSTSFQLNATSTSGLAVTYSSSDPSIATVTGNIVSLIQAGMTNITASQPGDVNYHSATDVSQQLTVNNKLPQVITFGPLAEATYGQPSISLNATGGESANPVTFVSSDPSVATVSGNTLTIAGAGITTITASQMGDAAYNAAMEVNQTFTIEKATLTATADHQSITFGEALPTFGIQYAGFAPGDTENELDILPSVTTTAVGAGGSDAGTYPIILTGGGDNNYELTLMDGTLTIAKANQAISFHSIPSIDLATIGTVTLSASSDASLPVSFALVEGDGTITGTTLTPNSAGDFTVEATQAGTTNYHSASATRSFTVTDSRKSDQSITFELLANKIYGDPDFELTATASSGLEVIYTSADETIVTISGSIVTIVGTGSTTITASQSGDANFNEAAIVSQDLIVTKANLNIMAGDQTKSYGSDNPSLSLSYNGFVNDEDESALTTPPTATTTADASSKVGAYSITVSGGEADNYTLSYEEGTLTVEAATLNVKADNQTKTYGSANPSLTLSYTGFVNDEDAGVLTIAPKVITTADVSSEVGAYLITPSGGEAENYTFSFMPGTLTIAKAPLTAIADPKTRVYNTENPALTLSYGGFVGDDSEADLDESPAVSTIAVPSSEVGDYTISVSGGEDDNYTIETVNGTLTITQADQLISFSEIPDIDLADTHAITLEASVTSNLTVTFSLIQGNGSIDMETNTLTVNAAGTFEVEASQSGNRNYSAAASEIRIFEVTDSRAIKEHQTITFGSIADKTYGGIFTLTATASSDLPVSFSVIGPARLSEDDVLTLTGIGEVTVTASQKGDDGFHKAPEVSHTFAVSKATLLVTANDQTRAYNTANPTFTLSYDGFISGDAESDLNVLPSVSTAADIASDVGTYTIMVSQGSDDHYDLQYLEGTLTITKAIANINLSDLEQEADGTAKEPTITTDPADLNYILTWDAGIAPIEAGDHDFAVIIEEKNYEAQTTSTFVLTEATLSANPKIHFRIYPNPVKEVVRVDGLPVVHLSIYDLAGRKISESRQAEIELHGLQSGVYVLHIQDLQGGKHTRRIVKE